MYALQAYDHRKNAIIRVDLAKPLQYVKCEAIDNSKYGRE